MNNTTEPTREQMYQWYVVEKKSYRQIMKITGIKNNRKIPKLLNQYGIEIRRGSEAVKTQWINNEDRRKKTGKRFADYNRGKPSDKRLSLETLQKRMLAKGMRVLKRDIIDGYTIMKCECVECGYIFERNLKNTSEGCWKCSHEKIASKQRTDFKVVEEAFNNEGLTLLDTEYKNNLMPMAFLCNKHASYGEQKQSYQGLREHGGCKYCRIERRRSEKEKKLSPRKAMAHLLKEWRIAVFERDNFICQCCGWDKGKILQAHHIKNFSNHPHLRLDIDNGITLCKNCHDPHIKGSFHNTYGTKNNNEEQLKEYLRLKASS